MRLMWQNGTKTGAARTAISIQKHRVQHNPHLCKHYLTDMFHLSGTRSSHHTEQTFEIGDAGKRQVAKHLPPSLYTKSVDGASLCGTAMYRPYRRVPLRTLRTRCCTSAATRWSRAHAAKAASFSPTAASGRLPLRPCTTSPRALRRRPQCRGWFTAVFRTWAGTRTGAAP